MRDPIILLVHLIATLARLMGPGGLRSVVAESVLVKQQLLILNRSRHRAPNLCASDRILAGVCALFMRPARVIRSAIVLRPSTILEFHRALRTRKYRWLFSPTRRRTGPQGPSKALVDAIVDMKRRNPRWGCPRIAQQIALAFAVDIDKDVVRRVLATHYRPAPHSGGPSWLTFLGHAKDSLWSIDLNIAKKSSQNGTFTQECRWCRYLHTRGRGGRRGRFVSDQFGRMFADENNEPLQPEAPQNEILIFLEIQARERLKAYGMGRASGSRRRRRPQSRSPKRLWTRGSPPGGAIPSGSADVHRRSRENCVGTLRPVVATCSIAQWGTVGRNVPLPELVAWFASFEADIVIEFVAPQDAMVVQLVRNRDNLAIGYTQDRFEACVAEHFVIAETERLQSGTRTMYYVRPKHAS